MNDFLASAFASLSDVSAGVYIVGAVIIAVAAAGYVIAKVRGLLGGKPPSHIWLTKDYSSFEKKDLENLTWADDLFSADFSDDERNHR